MTLEYGRQPSRPSGDDERSPLSHEIFRKHAKSAALGSGRRVNTINNAARDADLAKVKALPKGNPALAFIKVNNGATPLHLAAFKGLHVAGLLLANRAEVNSKDNRGLTPLHAAAVNGHQDVVELLRQHGGHE